MKSKTVNPSNPEAASTATHRPLRRVAVNPWVTRTNSVAEIHEPESDDLFVESFARGLAVIRSFANRNHPLTIADVGRRAGLSRSAARRLLHTLVSLGYARMEDDGFSLLPKTLLLGSAYLSSDALVELAQPLIGRFAARTGTFCSVSVPLGYATQLVCMAYLGQPPEVALPEPRLGSEAPMYCSSSGLLFLSEFTPEKFEDYLQSVKLESFTHHTVTDRSRLLARLQQVREEGYSLVDRELSNELRSLGVPVRDRTGRLVAVLAAMATPRQASVSEMLAWIPQLKAAARELGSQL